MKRNIVILIVAASAVNLRITQAAEIGHFDGGIADIRDYFIPDRGVYDSVYNYHYFSDRFNIAASFASNPDADLSIANSSDVGVNNSSFEVGDLYTQPVWLDGTGQHWDFLLAYGYYAPAVRYDGRSAAFPDGAVELRNNAGLGYWAQQHAEAGIAWYPMKNKATAFSIIWSYEYNRGMEYFDIKPGQLFTVSWEVSQQFPLHKDRKLLLQLGPSGYDSCQITDSTGGNALADAPKSHVHGLGGELGLVYVPWNAFLKLHSFYESAANSRYQGASIGLNFGIKF